MTPGAREDVAKASNVVVSSSGKLTKEGEGNRSHPQRPRGSEH